MIRRATAIFLTATAIAAAQIPAFPGAEGYGAYAKGGRGGDVYHVTNLNPSGAGSFIEGISTVPSAGRTIVFDVSGYIRLPSGSNGTRLTSSKVTIAGQTAPGDGIGFFNNFFRISGDDVVLRHLRFRHGKYGSGGDCIDLDSGSLNSVLDHVSMQFSTDENMSSFGSPPENLTLQYSLNAWGLESHSCGGLWDQNHASSHHNLWAHNHTRNPKARPNGLLEWVNNVTFDWDIGFIMGDSQSNQNWKSNVINNYFIGPSGNTHSKALVKGTVADNGTPNFTVYLSGNLIDVNGNGTLDGVDNGYSIVEGTANPPGTSGLTPGAAAYYQATGSIARNTGTTQPGLPVTTDAPLLAYKKIVSHAGALRLDAGYTGLLRDEVDSRLIAYLVALKAKHITGESSLVAADAAVGGFPVSNSGFGTLASLAAPTDTDRDGMPDTYETALGWTPTVQDHNTALANSGGIITGTTFLPPNSPAGYTRLEEYLHFLAIPHGRVAKNIAGSPTSITVDLRKFTSGFATSPSFGVGAVANGTFEQFLANGTTVSATGPIIKFTPTQGFFGRARFDFTVTEAGQSWTQTFAIVVTNEGVPRDLLWLGDGTANAWNTTSNNWVKSGSATAFSSGDTALFNDLGSNSPFIAVSGTLTAASVTVDSTKNYVLGGTGSTLAGGPLTKGGTGSLTLTNTGIAFTGGVISGGMVALGTDSANPSTENAAAFGTAAVSVSNAELRFGGKGGSTVVDYTIPNSLTLNNATITAADGRQLFTGTVAVNGGGASFRTQYNNKNLWIQGIMSGSAPLSVNDIGASFNGTVFFSAANTYSGVLTINPTSTGYGGGQISVNHVSAFQNATINNLSNRAGGGILFDAAVTTPAFGALSGSGSFALPSGTLTVGGNNASTDFSGALSGTGGLAKTGTGALTLYGSSNYTGATTVSAGALLVDNSLGNTAVAVSSGALLGGSGTINGTVTANSGSFLSPGTAPFTGATMTVSNGLTIGAATIYCDMQEAVLPALGTNDKIAITSGALTYNGAPMFQFLLLKGTLAGGNYNLITAPSSAFNVGVSTTFAHNLPSGTRQDFTVKRSGSAETPAYIRLEVVGDPATLTWSGSVSNVWQVDTSGTPSGWTGGSVAKPNFFNLDAVAFDDNAPSPAVTITGLVQPRAINVNNSSAKNYTFSGNGAIAGSGILTKSGTGTLTITLPASVTAASTNSINSTTVTVDSATGLVIGMVVEGNGVPAGTTITAISGTTLTVSQAVTAANSAASFTYSWRNSYNGGTVIETGSTIQLGNEAANRWGLGTGKVTFHGGTLKMYDFGANLPGSGEFPNAMVVPLGQIGNLFTSQRCALTGSLAGDGTGSGTLNLTIKYVRGDFYGDWSGFAGLVNINATAYAEFRTARDYTPHDFPLAEIHLGPNVVMKHTGNQNQGAGTIIAIGALSGTAGSNLLGGSIGGRALTYLIGGKGIDTTFSGGIGEQAPGSTLTNITKVGNGTWTLAGNNSWAGGTEVVAGTMAFGGTSTSGGAVSVASGATLQFVNGSLTTPEANINIGAKLAGYGAITGDMNCPGTLEGRGFASGIPGTLTIHGNAYFASTSALRLRAGTTADLVGVDGDLALEGTVQVSLPAGTPDGRYPMLTYGGMLALGTVSLTGVPAGTTAQLSTSIAGQVDLVVGDLGDSDNDGLVDSWETTNFNGSLAQTGTGDPDGDSFDNETEESAGTNPNSSSSIPNFTVAYYRFEEGAAGSQVPQAYSNAIIDAAGADDNMNAYSAATAPVYSNLLPNPQVPQTMAANTRSLQFDAANGGDDVYTNLQGPLQTRAFGSFTVEAYVRFTSLTGIQTIVGRDDTFGSLNGQNGIPQSLFYLSKSGSHAFRVELTTSTGTQIAVDSSSIASADTWYHLAAVGNVRTGILTLYVNGASAATVGGFTGLYNPANDDAWTIGRGLFNGAVADSVTGQIDEVRFSDLPLAPSRFLMTAFAGDSDSDGLPDAWETQYFGSPTAAVAGEDSDGDGQNNATEYLAGTHPKNGSSRFAANIAAMAGNQFSITWPSVPGKSYTILTGASPAGPWTPLTTVPAAGAPATATTRNVDADGSRRFYKVALSP